ncbi:hypothetical protein ACOZ4I_15670 [Haloarcula salina]|uniref:hypothetical protein n=1 Tax=Haloarcula salina TaxID=1429914 RepID=UPI003C6FBED2
MSVSLRLPAFSPREIFASLGGIERWLWVAMFGFYGAGDVLTSIVSMELGGHESVVWLNALIGQYGYGVLVVHKLGVLTIPAAAAGVLTVAAWKLNIRASPFRSAILLMFAARGALLVTWNCYVIYVLLTHDVPPETPVPF